ncbi:MAG: cyanophycinase [Acaryochloridaceae cyanobacterium RL_2_7]|nr:cyanophycinase [Acaryochloridaceae cyanobacterium RL_2_7]
MPEQIITVPQTTAQYPIMVIGGAEDKVNERRILSAFFESAGGRDASIAIIPCASREPEVVGNRYFQIFSKMGVKQAHMLDIRHADEANDLRWLDKLDQCSGVFVTGGDQLRLCDLISGSQLMARMQDKISRHQLVLAGTSAGAAMMGSTMIAGGSSGESPNPDLVDLTQGLGIIPEFLVDQHFHNRNRMARLLSAIAFCPDKLGIGIDEDTCAAVLGDGTFEVIGRGTITVVDCAAMTHTNALDVGGQTPLCLHNLKLHILSQGDRYNYRTRKVLS